MAENSHISWTDHTVNFWIGCVKVSPLCDNCYAERDATRYGKDFERDRTPVKSVWNNIAKWQAEAKRTGERKRVFCMSMGDFFERLPDGHKDFASVAEARARAIEVMEQADALEWLVLTKRISNVPKMVPVAWMSRWPGHIRLGISVGTQKDADRDIPRLLEIPAPNFLSMEPLLEKVSVWRWLDPNDNGYENGLYWVGKPGIDWVITGGESGAGSRPGHPDWYRALRDECQQAGVPFHFKQWGEWLPMKSADEASLYVGKSMHEWEDGIRSVRAGRQAAGHMLDGREWFEFPK